MTAIDREPRSRLWLTVALAALAGSVWTAAQQTPVAVDPIYRAATTFVTTDVVPRDRAGRFVPDLTVKDFALLEDGAPRPIASLTLVHGGRTFDLLTLPSPAPEGVLLPAARPSAGSSSGRLFAVIVDDLHIEPEYTPHVRRLVQTLASTLLQEGDRVMMVSTGPSGLQVDLTHDRGFVASSVSRIRGSGPTAAEIFQTPETSEGAGDLRRRARMAFQAASNVLSELERVRNVRKAVIYISSGYDLDPFAAGRRGRDRIQGGRFAEPIRVLQDPESVQSRSSALGAAGDLADSLRAVTLAAHRANARIYAVDPRGLSGVVDAGQYLDQSDWRAFLQTSQASLRLLSEETGGFAVVNTNDFAADFARIDADLRDYYVLGYYSTAADAGSAVRTTTVTVTRPGVEIEVPGQALRR